jgi:hypothetical protein
MSRYDTLFSPLTIKHLRIRNRLRSTSPAPGYAVGGRITERYRSYQAEKARGGVGLTQFGGATSVSAATRWCYSRPRASSADRFCSRRGRRGAAARREAYSSRVKGRGFRSGAVSVSMSAYSLFTVRSLTHFRPFSMGVTRFSRFQTR